MPSSKERHILFILSETPYPVHKNGLTLINYYILQHMPRHWHVDIFASSGTAEEAAALKRAFPHVERVLIEKVSGSAIAKKVKQIASLFRGMVIPHADGRVRRLVGKNSYDLVYIAPLAMSPRALGLGPTFLNAVDSLSLLNLRFYESSKSFKYVLRSQVYKFFEKMICSHVDMVNFVSSVDAEHVLRHASTATIQTIPNGVDTKYFLDRRLDRWPNSLLFTGNFSYQPNREAAIYLVNSLLPKLVKRNPTLRLYLVGKNPPFPPQESSNLVVTGYVDDISEYYNNCSVFICPLFSGAGIKNKLLEAMSCGLPVISTSVGVDGIDGLIEDKHFIAVNTEDEFVETCLRVMDDHELRTTLAKNAADLIKTRYSWESATQQYFDSFEKIWSRTAAELPDTGTGKS